MAAPIGAAILHLYVAQTLEALGHVDERASTNQVIA